MMELSLLITAILGIIVLYFIFWLLKTKNDHWEKLGVPSVTSPPIIGFLWELIFNNKGVGDVMYELYTKFNEQKFIGYYQFLSPAIMVRDPELVNQVLIKDFTHFEDRIFPMKGPKSILSLGVGSLTGDEWRNARHKLTPTFTSGKLKMMSNPTKECSDELLRHIENSLGEEFEAKDLMFKFVLNVSANVGFGIKLNVFDEKDKQSQDFIKYTSMFNKPSVLFLIKHMIAAWVPKLRAIFNFRLMEEDVEMFFKGLTHDVIKTRKNSNIRRNDFLQLVLDEQEKELINDLGSNKSLECKSADAEDKELLDQLKNTPLGSSDSLKPVLFTEEFISAQSFIFISTGSHTTATVLSVALYELAAHQDLQKKVQNEIINVFSSKEFSYEALRKLTYTEQFLNEVMRLHPTALALIRICTGDYKIPGTEITLPKGSLVNIPIIGLHKDPLYFPDPEKLDPERFENMDAIPKGVFLPFGGGPRICIAMRLAMLKMKILLSRLLLNYTVVFGEKMEHPLKTSKNSYVLRIESEIWVKFKRRET